MSHLCFLTIIHIEFFINLIHICLLIVILWICIYSSHFVRASCRDLDPISSILQVIKLLVILPDGRRHGLVTIRAIDLLVIEVNMRVRLRYAERIASELTHAITIATTITQLRKKVRSSLG